MDYGFSNDNITEQNFGVHCVDDLLAMMIDRLPSVKTTMNSEQC